MSDFFSVTIENKLKESEAGTVKLPEQAAKMIQYIVHWLYMNWLTEYFQIHTDPSIIELVTENSSKFQQFTAVVEMDEMNKSSMSYITK